MHGTKLSRYLKILVLLWFLLNLVNGSLGSAESRILDVEHEEQRANPVQKNKGVNIEKFEPNQRPALLNIYDYKSLNKIVSPITSSWTARPSQAILSKAQNNNKITTTLPVSYLVERTINDLTLTDLIIVADIEGYLHAVNRSTGETKWSLNSTEFEPLVKIEQQSSVETKETLIVEPSKDGLLYFFHANQGLQRIPASVRQLIDSSPVYMKAALPIDNHGTIIEDEKIYTGSRSSVLYTIDLNSGDIVSAYGFGTRNFAKCFHNDDDKCPIHPANLLTIGKSIYHLQIDSHSSSVYNVTYAEWQPNSLDSHLSSENTIPGDGLFITPFQDKTLLAVDTHMRVAKWISSEFPGVITTIFDVFIDNYSFETVLVAHPLHSVSDKKAGENMVYLEQIENQSWVAFSIANYPSLVKAAPLSKYITSNNWRSESIFKNEHLFKTCVTGVHILNEPSFHFSNEYPSKPQNTLLLIDPVPYESKALVTKKSNTYLNQEIMNDLEEVEKDNHTRRHIKSSIALYILKFCYKVFENGLILIVSVLILGVLQRLHLVPPIGTMLNVFGLAPAFNSSNNNNNNNDKIDKEVKFLESEQNYSKDETTIVEGMTKTVNQYVNSYSSDTLVKEEPDIITKKKRKRGIRGGKNNKRKGNTLEINEASENLKHLVVSDKVLGYGSSGTVVFEGKFQGRPVAVKRMLLDFCDLANREIELLTESDNHSNIIRYYCSETTEKFLYIALELCNASLQDIIEMKTPKVDISSSLLKSLDPINILFQITSGVAYLHSLKIIHRDIKPQNILLAVSKIVDKKTDLETEKVRILISDFGLCKKLDVDQSSFRTNLNNPAGTTGWRAPELLNGSVVNDDVTLSNTTLNKDDCVQESSYSSTGTFYDPCTNQRLTRAIDIFSLGCVFYYVLSKGEHPFGDKFIREANIINGHYDLDHLKKTVEYKSITLESTDLIKRMIDKDPKKRPTAAIVLKHPLFWPISKKMIFLLKVSDRFEIENKEPKNQLLMKLNVVSSKVIKNRDWSSKFDQKFMENLGKYRKYHFERVLDLLRAIRNKYHHFIDLPEDLAKEMGPLPDGFYKYFIRKFPNLLMEVYLFVEENMKDEQMFSEFF